MAKQLTIQAGVIVLVIGIATFLANQGTAIWGAAESGGKLKERVDTLWMSEEAQNAEIHALQLQGSKIDASLVGIHVEQRVMKEEIKETSADIKEIQADIKALLKLNKELPY